MWPRLAAFALRRPRTRFGMCLVYIKDAVLVHAVDGLPHEVAEHPAEALVIGGRQGPVWPGILVDPDRCVCHFMAHNPHACVRQGVAHGGAEGATISMTIPELEPMADAKGVAELTVDAIALAAGDVLVIRGCASQTSQGFVDDDLDFVWSVV